MYSNRVLIRYILKTTPGYHTIEPSRTTVRSVSDQRTKLDKRGPKNTHFVYECPFEQTKNDHISKVTQSSPMYVPVVTLICAQSFSKRIESSRILQLTRN